jgi:ABC-type uncharacterized transport system permease subunit
MARPRIRALAFGAAGIALALLLATVVLVAAKAPPLAAYREIVMGAFGTSDVVVSWVPLLLVSSGLLATFTSGLWNIGVEGQITVGAIFATWTLRAAQGGALDPALAVILCFVAGIVGGGLWAALAGALKTFGGVNEIFGGLGLNFVASALNLWLIFGPWKRPGVASMSGTLPFDPSLWLPTVNEQSRLAPIAVVIALVGLVIVLVLIQGTRFGLRLKAIGKNSKAAYLLGIPTWQHMIASFAICGVFAGAAGAIQVTSVYHRLIPSISSGYGYMGLMVAMLSNYRAAVAAPVAFFFAALNVGSIQLPISLRLDSTLAGVLQGSLVLFVLLAQGAGKRLSDIKRTTRGGEGP